MAGRNNYEINNKKFYNVLTPQETEKYLTLTNSGDCEAREILITRNLGLVYHIAKKFKYTGFEEEELISIGCIGLIKGINTFELSKGIMLSTYIGKCIQNEILIALRKNKKLKFNEISIEEAVSYDKEGNKLKIADLLKGTDEYEIYEKMEKVKEIFEYILNKFHCKEKLYILYYLAGYKQIEIAKKTHISQTYVSKQLKTLKEELKYLQKVSNKCEFYRYTIEIQDEFYKVFFKVDDQRTYKMCKKIISEDNYKADYNELKRTVSIIIKPESDAYLLLAKLVECIENIKC